MKQKIRYDVFESNSSSEHTLVIPAVKDAKKNTDLTKIRATIDLTDPRAEDFELHSGDDLTTVHDKLLYIWCAIVRGLEYNEIWAYRAEETIKSTFPSVKFKMPQNDDWIPYINHQSSDVVFVKEMMYDADLLRDAMLYGTIHLWSDCCTDHYVEKMFLKQPGGYKVLTCTGKNEEQILEDIKEWRKCEAEYEAENKE